MKPSSTAEFLGLVTPMDEPEAQPLPPDPEPDEPMGPAFDPPHRTMRHSLRIHL